MILKRDQLGDLFEANIDEYRRVFHRFLFADWASELGEEAWFNLLIIWKFAWMRMEPTK
ncbi:MAG TPA: hypothetical protein VNZ25_10545 [Candidatus Angelobacter sp.]|jgi:hypothetical protein|nr:hypothetical protein [Candidatus Angelobacter sp.]